MKSKRVLKWLLVLVVGIWFVVTIFFYFQHNIQVESYPIEKYIEFEEFGVLIKNIEKRNFERNYIDYSSFYRFNLHSKIIRTLTKVKHFYSIPYDVDDENVEYDVNCEVIFDPHAMDAERVRELVKDQFNIEFLKNDSDLYMRWRHESSKISSGRNIIYMSYHEKGSQDSIAGVKIVDERNREEQVILFDQPFLIHKYSFFNPLIPEEEKSPTSVVRDFLRNYYKQDKRLEIDDEYSETFQWDKLNQFVDFSATYLELSYFGHYMNDDQVFVMKVIEEKQDDSLVKELNFYMVYKDMSWKIIDVK